MHAFTEARGDWLTVVRLPAYAPDLNPVAGLAPQHPCDHDDAECRG